MKKSNQGFTLIELLVVIAIIGLLSTLAVVALNSARQRSRDAKRVADIRQFQTALELGFSETNDYPIASGVNLGSGDQLVMCSDGASAPQNQLEDKSADCSGTIFMGLVPSNPSPNGTQYLYDGDGTDYSLTFTLEGTTGQLGAGTNCANPDGITAGSSC